ncbi:MAG TPA: STAS domain-containing protein [Gammaproteobacteria bacterium]|nr:STAS domain-containing protein [Gammaproteobacteria bacterium]
MAGTALQKCSNGRLELCGDLSFETVPGLWRDCARCFAEQDTLEIDLDGVERADSAGVALLVECMRQAHQSGKTLRFFNMPAQMLALARVSSLDQVLPLQRD